MRRIIELDGEFHVAKITSDLTQTYDFAEHQKPDAVILSHALSDCPEFELLASLFRIMGIGCIVVGTHETPLPAESGPSIARIATDAPDQALLSIIRQVCSRATRTGAPSPPRPQSQTFDPTRLILIGSSAGGVEALLNVLKHFTNTCPPTLIVQHTGGQFAASLARLLDSGTAANVLPAASGMCPEAGHIYLAPDDTAHLRLARSRRKRIEIWPGDPVMGHRPSVDVMFQSAIPFGQDIIAAILTGMGRDGANGLAALRRAGARTIGQDEASSVIYGMPRVAHELGGVEKQLPIHEIGPALLSAAKLRTIA
ncbi:CheB methylesterase domain-containing protein [Yoonia sediminilitoris]|nr:CheB methylesterase domain-containing protein [Yoonia sediminilitoris]